MSNEQKKGVSEDALKHQAKVLEDAFRKVNHLEERLKDVKDIGWREILDRIRELKPGDVLTENAVGDIRFLAAKLDYPTRAMPALVRALGFTLAGLKGQISVGEALTEMRLSLRGIGNADASEDKGESLWLGKV